MDVLYEVLQIVAMVIAIVFTALWAKFYGVSRLKALLIAGFSSVVCFVGVFVLTWAENGFRQFGAQNAVRAYPFLLLVGILEAKIFRIDLIRCIEFQAVNVPLTYGLGHFACLTRMCCFGFQYQEGTFAYKVAQALTGTNQLPMQIFESVSSLLIFAVIVIVAVKTRFKVTGYLFVFFQIAFGATRFFWEFLRDNDKLIVFGPMKGAVSAEGEAVWGISNLAFWALAIFVAGVILLICLKRYHKNEAKKQASAS